MINELLILGQVPGTDFQITFNEMVAAFCIGYLFHVYLNYSIEIKRWRKRSWYRICINYRRQNRHIKSVIRYKRYRLAVFERRIIRNIRTYVRRRRHTFYMTTIYRPYSSLKRRYYIKLVQLERLDRRIRRSQTVRAFISIKDFVRQSG